MPKSVEWHPPVLSVTMSQDRQAYRRHTRSVLLWITTHVMASQPTDAGWREMQQQLQQQWRRRRLAGDIAFTMLAKLSVLQHRSPVLFLTVRPGRCDSLLPSILPLTNYYDINCYFSECKFVFTNLDHTSTCSIISLHQQRDETLWEKGNEKIRCILTHGCAALCMLQCGLYSRMMTVCQNG